MGFTSFEIVHQYHQDIPYSKKKKNNPPQIGVNGENILMLFLLSLILKRSNP